MNGAVGGRGIEGYSLLGCERNNAHSAHWNHRLWSTVEPPNKRHIGNKHFIERSFPLPLEVKIE